MSKISLEGIASKMSANQMKNVTGGSSSGATCSTSTATCSGSCSFHGRSGSCRVSTVLGGRVCACIIG